MGVINITVILEALRISKIIQHRIPKVATTSRKKRVEDTTMGIDKLRPNKTGIPQGQYTIPQKARVHF